MSSIETKLGPLLGLHFRNVLGDALRAEWGFARRLSRVPRRSSRHCVRSELVHLLRGCSGVTVHSRVGRGDDLARSAHLLRSAGHRSVRSRDAGCAADLGAMGRQHHRGARRPRKSRSGSRRVDFAFATPALFAATHPSRTTALVVLDGYADAGGTTTSFETKSAARSRCGARASCSMSESGHAVERRDPGNVGADERLAASPATYALMRGLASNWMCGRSFRPSVCRLLSSSAQTTCCSTREGQVHRRSHSGREVR